MCAITALSDEVVSAAKFRREMKGHFDRARQGVVVTVTSGSDEEPVAVVRRRYLAALIEAAQRLEEIEAELDAEHLARDAEAQEALTKGVDQITRGEGLDPDEVRTRLGRPRKER